MIKSDDWLAPEEAKRIRSDYNQLCKNTLSEIQLTNFLWNAPIMNRYPGVLGFEGLFKRKPSVIVGIGPSLDKQLPLLKEHREKFILITVESALPILFKHGIVPDFACMVDPNKAQANFFKDIDTTLFYTIVPPVVHPAVFRAVDPQHLCIYNVKDPTSPILEAAPFIIGSKGALPAGVLTSGTCFGLAACLGTSPIFFVGHDLSWPTVDKVYASDVPEGKVLAQKRLKFKCDCMLFPDINGDLVLTHVTFYNFWAWLNDCVNVLDVKVINCSEAGILKSKQIDAIPFTKALSKYMRHKLVGVREAIDKAVLEERYPGGAVERLLRPKLRKARSSAKV